MPAAARGLRLGVRVVESLALSAVAGALVWLVALVAAWVPLLSPAVLGLLAGSTTLLRTLGAVIARRSQRVALAALCACLGYATVAALDYARFVHDQRRAQRALDDTATPAEVDARIRRDLEDRTGRAGPRGYLLAAIAEGTAHAGVTLRGPARVAFASLEIALAIGVAMWWASGPRRRPTPG